MGKIVRMKSLFHHLNESSQSMVAKNSFGELSRKMEIDHETNNDINKIRIIKFLWLE